MLCSFCLLIFRKVFLEGRFARFQGYCLFFGLDRGLVLTLGVIGLGQGVENAWICLQADLYGVGGIFDALAGFRTVLSWTSRRAMPSYSGLHITLLYSPFI